MLGYGYENQQSSLELWRAVYSPEPLKNMSSTYVGKMKLTWIIKLHQMIPLQLLYTLWRH